MDHYMPKDSRSFQYKVWKLIMSKTFEYIILLMIGLNTIVLMMKVSQNRPLTNFYVIM